MPLDDGNDGTRSRANASCSISAPKSASLTSLSTTIDVVVELVCFDDDADAAVVVVVDDVALVCFSFELRRLCRLCFDDAVAVDDDDDVVVVVGCEADATIDDLERDTRFG